jgi:hypothetical protein
MSQENWLTGQTRCRAWNRRSRCHYASALTTHSARGLPEEIPAQRRNGRSVGAPGPRLDHVAARRATPICRKDRPCIRDLRESLGQRQGSRSRRGPCTNRTAHRRPRVSATWAKFLSNTLLPETGRVVARVVARESGYSERGEHSGTRVLLSVQVACLERGMPGFS